MRQTKDFTLSTERQTIFLVKWGRVLGRFDGAKLLDFTLSNAERIYSSTGGHPMALEVSMGFNYVPDIFVGNV